MTGVASDRDEVLMRRREFIALIGGAAALPLAGRAQQRGRASIGVLHGGAEASDTPRDRIPISKTSSQ